MASGCRPGQSSTEGLPVVICPSEPSFLTSLILTCHHYPRACIIPSKYCHISSIIFTPVQVSSILCTSVIATSSEVGFPPLLSLHQSLPTRLRMCSAKHSFPFLPSPLQNLPELPCPLKFKFLWKPYKTPPKIAPPVLLAFFPMAPFM